MENVNVVYRVLGLASLGLLLSGCQPASQHQAQSQDDDASQPIATTNSARNQTESQLKAQRHDLDGVTLRRWVLPNFQATIQTTDKLVQRARRQQAPTRQLQRRSAQLSAKRAVILNKFEGYRGHNISVGTAAVYDCDEVAQVGRQVIRAAQQHRSLKVPLQHYATARQDLLTDVNQIQRLLNYA
ncbi:hypothetical protein GCM10022296_19570 [Secundilactobacillus similis DSM 23365 = JCM 2765]|uniref:Uncharacterized protein n=1 Tax=Secundilactobacillus similis DSM 23365 = JCM 2765 TaxID=1423804 RepID=A0A0R2FFT8_9LACO|nr:hypothetical protein FD14_GL001400 [Secundilactobacillus similis DSM 23365 = JCM 2765]